MKKGLLFTSLTFITITSFGQANSNYSLTAWTSVRRPQEYLTMTKDYNSILDERENENIIVRNSSKQIQNSYQAKRRLFVTLTIPLIGAYLIANQANKKDLAAGFAVGGLVTSSLGLYFMIKEDKQNKGKK